MILRIEQGKNNPILRTPSEPVKIFDDKLRRLVEDMKETLAVTKNGVGLAAPQVRKNIQLFVIAPEFGTKTEGQLVYINPVVVRVSRWRKETLQEGCLSLPGDWAELSRPQKVTIRARDERGNNFKVRGHNLLARLFLHEVDHLDGVLFIDRLK